MRRNFTIDDMSPLINYIPITSWQDGNSVDIKKDKYFGGTFRLSTLKDAKAAFTFNGTGVWILGAKRANHGPYTSTIDGGGAITLDGFSPPPGIYQVPLVTRANLALGVHTVEIVNARAIDDRPYLDVDAFIWETEIPDDTNTSLILDDNHHAMQYLPSAAAWSNNTCPEVARYSGGTCHETSDPKGTLRLFFRGELITVYGGLGPDRGPYTVTLDSREPVHLTAISESYQTQQVIYFADNLGPGDHMLTISNNPSKAGEILDIDYISIWGNPTITDILNGGLSNSPTNPGSTHRRGLQTGQLIGLIVGVSLGVLLAVVASFIWYRMRQSWRIPTQVDDLVDSSGEELPQNLGSLRMDQDIATATQITPYPSHLGRNTNNPSEMSDKRAIQSGESNSQSLTLSQKLSSGSLPNSRGGSSTDRDPCTLDYGASNSTYNQSAVSRQAVLGMDRRHQRINTQRANPGAEGSFRSPPPDYSRLFSFA